MKSDCKIFIFILFSTLINFLATLPIVSQERGKTFISNYSTREYEGHIQNWDIVQDTRGLLYFANGDGILEYDGTNFKLISLALKNSARSLAIDSSGIIYYGSANDFGFLYPDSLGKLMANSLKTLVGKKDKNFGVVSDIIAKENTVYFRTYKKLFRYKKGNLKCWSFKHNISAQFVFKDNLYIKEAKIGLKILESDTFRLLSNIRKNKGQRLTLSLPYDSVSTIFGERYSKLKIFFPKSGYVDEITTDIDDILSKVRLYSACISNNEDYALGTDGAGLYIINKSGKLLQEINERTGLQNQSVLNVKADNQENLWLALNNGISKVVTSSPITYWDKSIGLTETPEAILRFKGIMYIGTQGGIFYLADDRLVKIKNYDQQCWSLIDFHEPGDTSKHHLLAGTYDGIYEIKDNQLIKIFNSQATSRRVVLFL